jgi:mono/diheme cytochrome c family protein
MKPSPDLNEQQGLNEEMLRAINTLTKAGFLLLLVLVLLFWKNSTWFFGNHRGVKPSAQYIEQPQLSPTAQKGKILFKNNCATCHNKDMRTPLTGPALGGATQRWAAYPREDLYQWIRNSQALIQQKHPRALELWKQWKPVIMNAFNSLSDEDIEAVLAYVEAVEKS